MRIILLSALLLATTGWLWGQNSDKVLINGDYDNKLLDLVFLDLEIGYRLVFEFEEEHIEGIRVSTYFRKVPVELAMAKILEGTGLSFELKGPRTVSVFPAYFRPQVADVSEVEPTQRDFTVTGVVKDGKTGETLPFASLQIDGTNLGVTTNVDGYFTLLNVPSDTALLLVNYIGYQPTQFRLLPGMDMESIEIDMADFGVQLDEVLVAATKKEQMLSASSGISRISVAPAALSKLPSYGEKDIFRSLQLLPGVSGSNESSAGLFVRGGTPDQNLILFDGFTVYHVDHLFGFFSAFNANAIKDVQLYKGGFDAKYGGRLSSVVDMTGKDGNTEQFNAGFGLSLLSFNGFVEAPFADGKGSFLVAGRRSFQSDFYSNIFDAYTNANEANSDGPALPGPFSQLEVQPNTYFYDLNAKVTYRPSDKDILSFSFYNGQDNLDNSRNIDESIFDRFAGFGGGSVPDFTFNSSNTDLTEWGNWGSGLKWSRRWNGQLYSNINLSYSNYYSERDTRNSTTIERGDSTITRNQGTYEFNDLRDISFKWDNEYKISAQNQLDFGFQTTYNNIEYRYSQNDTISIIDRLDEGWTSSLYVQDRHTFGNKLIVKGGLRASHYTPTGDFFFEPRANLTYLVTDKIKLKGAWGEYYQFANRIVREDIQQGSRDFWLLADDERVPISSSVHNIVGASYENSGWLFDVEAYYKTLDGLSEYSTRFVPSGFGPDRTLDYEEFFFNGDGVAQGMEFLVQRKVGKFTGWAGYTLGEVLYDFPDFSEEPFAANQDVTHELKLVGTYRIRNWTFGASFIYATGRPYTAPVGFYEITLLDGSTSDFFEVSDKNELRFADYHRLDLSVTYDFNWDRSKGSFGLSLFNLYNRRNTWYNEYQVIEGELLETEVSLLGLTPSVFINWSLR
ncbi:MAG: TonB-dependent receptor [Bacteroidota bacterium]